MKSQAETRYIAFLRGINVGGHTVKMEVLRQPFSDLGFTNVRSYIQSGNIFFDSHEPDRTALRANIEAQLETALGYTVPTCVRSAQELEELLQMDPFRGIELTADKRFSVVLLAEPASINLSLPYRTPDGGYEIVAKTTAELFVVWHLQNGRPSSKYGLIEKMTLGPVTTRFWHTMAKIQAAAIQS